MYSCRKAKLNLDKTVMAHPVAAMLEFHSTKKTGVDKSKKDQIVLQLTGHHHLYELHDAAPQPP